MIFLIYYTIVDLKKKEVIYMKKHTKIIVRNYNGSSLNDHYLKIMGWYFEMYFDFDFDSNYDAQLIEFDKQFQATYYSDYMCPCYEIVR